MMLLFLSCLLIHTYQKATAQISAELNEQLKTNADQEAKIRELYRGRPAEAGP